MCPFIWASCYTKRYKMGNILGLQRYSIQEVRFYVVLLARQKLISPVDKRDISHKEIRDHTWKRKMRSNKKSHVKIIACKIIIIQVVSVYFVNIIPTLNRNIIKCLKYFFPSHKFHFNNKKYFYDVFKNGRLSKIYRRLYSNASSQDRHGLLWSFFAKTYKKNIHILMHTRTHIINKNAFYSSRKKVILLILNSL